METDVKNIGIFGFSFSRDLDQTWFNIWRKENGFSIDFFQDVESDDDEDDEMINSAEMVSFEQGEALLAKILADGKIGQWKESYADGDEGMEANFNWTLDIDDLEEKDLMFSSGNGVLPPRELTMSVVEAIRSYEPRFLACFKEF